ncbi:MAG TPA: VOC family protein [Chthonomonadaceae bacterium]|nr:VOC family protein [Chthonomonadaceae bacterium]
MAHFIVWFDMPVTDLQRATQFYARVLATSIERGAPDQPMAIFAHNGDQVAGCLFQEAGCQPSAQGPLLYFNVNGRLDDALAQVEANGGKILQPKHSIGPYGFGRLFSTARATASRCTPRRPDLFN